jgi:hypothetical protein
MRTLQEHKVNPANDTLDIHVLDEPGSGGANHVYVVTGFDPAEHPGVESLEKLNDQLNEAGIGASGIAVLFQNGPIADVGVNGVTHEALLAIVADRLRSFQNGPFKTKANACALSHIEEAQHWLQQRTLERMRRGVEGTHAV